MKPKSLIIPAADYQRIFRVVKGVFDSVDAHTTHACIFFAEVGAAMLSKFYRKEARVVAGNAFYLVDDATLLAVSFADMYAQGNPTKGAAFHCWIECDDFVVDFMAPLFREFIAAAGHLNNTPRRMFQKRRSAMAPSHATLEKEGDFHLIPSEQITREAKETFLRVPASRDLERICLHWYRKPPLEIDSTMVMQDNTGAVTRIHLAEMRVGGAW